LHPKIRKYVQIAGENICKIEKSQYSWRSASFQNQSSMMTVLPQIYMAEDAIELYSRDIAVDP
jgi:hypothetical protein